MRSSPLEGEYPPYCGVIAKTSKIRSLEVQFSVDRGRCEISYSCCTREVTIPDTAESLLHRFLVLLQLQLPHFNSEGGDNASESFGYCRFVLLLIFVCMAASRTSLLASIPPMGVDVYRYNKSLHIDAPA